MFKNYVIFALAAYTLIFAAPAHAQAITSEVAQQLQTTFQALLEDKQQDLKQQQDRTLELSGNVTVEPSDDFYAITFPQMRIIDKDGERIEIGLISINASPHSEPGQYKMTMALPRSISGFDKAGEEIIRLSIGQQKTAGIWHEELQNFTKLDALYSDINIDIFDDNASIAIAEMRTLINLDQDESERWSGPTNFAINGIETKHDKGSASIQKIAAGMVLDQFTTDAFKGIDTEVDLKNLLSLTNADGLETTLSVEGIKANNEDGEEINLQSASAAFKLDDMLSGALDAHLSLGFTNMHAISNDIETSEVQPDSGQINITHHNIPIKDLAPLIENGANNKQALGLSLLFKIPAILAQAGSYIEINNSFVKNKNYNLGLNGVVRADIAAVNSATGEAELRFAGLDKVLSFAQVEGTKPTDGFSKFMRDVARMLERFKPLANVETDEKLGYVHVFNFEMNKTGQILVNGKDVSGVMNAEPSPAAAQAAPLKDTE